MSIARLTIVLKDLEAKALLQLADQEYRHPRAQAALIIRAELERRGLLSPPPREPTSPKTAKVVENYE
jgi:hypothetical protein